MHARARETLDGILAYLDLLVILGCIQIDQSEIKRKRNLLSILPPAKSNSNGNFHLSIKCN